MNPAGPDLKAIVCEAADHAAGLERSAYLDRVCHGDAALRQQVESLLKARDEAGGFLGSPAKGPEVVAAPVRDATFDSTPEPEGDPTPSADWSRIAEGPGTMIGPYKLLQKIGEGGMGAVFMAEQTQPVRRRVALKVIKPGMDTGQVVARFEAERQALAIMDHQNIARVLDAGATETGRPFFVMELVKGVPITEYCDQNNL
jgi:eukaryotic-like serine/threonine-protein kinase